MTKHIPHKLNNHIIIVLHNTIVLGKRMTFSKFIGYRIIDDALDNNLAYCGWSIYNMVKLGGKRLYGPKGFPAIYYCNTGSNTLYVKN